MGLDMHLFGIDPDANDDFAYSGKYKEVCYWRKANQIHKWFSVRFIKKQDPWGYYEVREEDLQGLLLVCKLLKQLKESSEPNWVPTEFSTYMHDYGKTDDYADLIAYALLPPDNLGCFFGSGIIDKYYWYQIDDTIKQLTNALSGKYSKFFYMASW